MGAASWIALGVFVLLCVTLIVVRVKDRRYLQWKPPEGEDAKARIERLARREGTDETG